MANNSVNGLQALANNQTTNAGLVISDFASQAIWLRNIVSNTTVSVPISAQLLTKAMASVVDGATVPININLNPILTPGGDFAKVAGKIKARCMLTNNFTFLMTV